MIEPDDDVITAQDVEELNGAVVARTAAFVRIAGTVLVVVGVVGCAAWLWTTVRTQQAVSASVNFGIPASGPKPDVDLIDRVDLFAPYVPAVVTASLVVGFGLLLRLVADFVVARAGGSLTGFEAGDRLAAQPTEVDL
jgi:hypothetical protein